MERLPILPSTTTRNDTAGGTSLPTAKSNGAGLISRTLASSDSGYSGRGGILARALGKMRSSTTKWSDDDEDAEEKVENNDGPSAVVVLPSLLQVLFLIFY